MKTKKILSFAFILTLSLGLMSAVAPSNPAVNNSVVITDIHSDEDVREISKEVPKLSLDDILNLTPKKYQKLTGKKMSLKQTIALKVAQKKIKKFLSKPEGDISKGGYIVLAILGWGWLAIGLKTDFSGDEWWISLLLYFLCYLPGLIYTLVKMKKFY
jgi:uncharacterized membrane protein YqaE (UPF0057 family)